MKNKTFFNALLLAFAFTFFANTMQAQYMQTLYKVTGGLFIEDGKGSIITEEMNTHISIYETAETKLNIAIISELGNVGYQYATWPKYGSYVSGSMPISGLRKSNKELRPTETEAIWKHSISDDKSNIFYSQIYVGQSEPAIEILFILYDDQGKEHIIYTAKAVFYGRIELE